MSKQLNIDEFVLDEVIDKMNKVDDKTGKKKKHKKKDKDKDSKKKDKDDKNGSLVIDINI